MNYCQYLVLIPYKRKMMNNREKEIITVPIELDAKKVKMLVEFLNSSDDEEMCIFTEDILREANDVSLKMSNTTKSIMKENPYSQSYL